MKTLLSLTSFLMVIFLFSCEKREQKPQTQSAHTPKQNIAAQQTTANTDVRTVVVEEVIQVSSYTYLKVREADETFWMAITKREIQTGETISFTKALKQENFTSKELDRTFDMIYFVGEISTGSAPVVSAHTAVNPHQKPAVEIKAVSVEPAKGGVSIGELFASRASYSGKTVKVRGQVTKFNQDIMSKNWAHIQDGTGGPRTNDLTVTTQDVVAVGDVITFEGTITLNKDFGAGYSYEVIMENAKKQAE
ncbi:MAG: SH3-like domain-containing protein [Anaerohalosphaera sp.]|nr:SH3-like domain-containing protein [Anaerohalosphaera sp.]